jgi:hypothetical protein
MDTKGSGRHGAGTVTSVAHQGNPARILYLPVAAEVGAPGPRDRKYDGAITKVRCFQALAQDECTTVSGAPPGLGKKGY